MSGSVRKRPEVSGFCPAVHMIHYNTVIMVPIGPDRSCTVPSVRTFCSICDRTRSNLDRIHYITTLLRLSALECAWVDRNFAYRSALRTFSFSHNQKKHRRSIPRHLPFSAEYSISCQSPDIKMTFHDISRHFATFCDILGFFLCHETIYHRFCVQLCLFFKTAVKIFDSIQELYRWTHDTV